ncbi:MULTISPECIES: Crp/Fnr family transcriptional regulator [unclassified Ruegeria]|uniref:Crp/Fnr family transcriptional regulator n=1 Tax=unclassified Ruegeria TaxID=2625375 RepID=UPI001AE16CB9|nr:MULTISPECIES: Crp/Fnr family transcriptional regulator [unclassified Ruegeria]
MKKESKDTFFPIFSSAWLRGVSQESLEKLKQISEIVTYKDKETIYAIGGPQSFLYGTVSGKVQVRLALTEIEPVLGHIHHPGAWFGESELLLGVDGLVEMKAAGGVRLVRIAYSRFRPLANERPDLWEAFARLASMNQLLAMSAANDLAQRNTRKRITAALLRLGGWRGALQGAEPTDTVVASQQELADLSNIALSKISVYLGEMATEGLIRLEYGRTVLLDLDGLRRVVEE